MPKGNHGDRSAEPRPIEDLIAQHELEVEQPALAEGIGDLNWHDFNTAENGRLASVPFTEPDVDIDAGTRMQAAAIAGGSFGAAGCFDDDILLRRANAVFNFIKNGLQ